MPPHPTPLRRPSSPIPRDGEEGLRLRSALARGCALCAVLAASAAWAQEPPLSPEENALLLETIFLQGSTYETEQSPSYAADLLSVGDKDTRYPREIPQSTTVLTHQRIEDGGFTSLDSAMRKTPGVMPLVNDDGRSSIYSRGFEFDAFSMNGLATPLSSLYGLQPDLVVVDHVEILRGPAGLFAGSGEPAGAINMRLKQPTDEFQLKFGGLVGSWDNRRVEGDVGGPLNASGTIRGRLIGAYGARDSWVDHLDNKVGVVYGVVQADVTPDTTATLSIHHRARDITPSNGLPTYADGTLMDLPVSTFTGADWNYFDNRVTDYLAEVEHKFEDGGHAKVSGIYTRADADMHYAFTGTAASATGEVTRLGWLARDYDQTSMALDAHVSKPFDLFGLEQNLIFGADYRSNETTILNQQGQIAGSFNLWNWDAAIPRPAVSYVTRAEADADQYGFYGQWRVKPHRDLTAILGGRLSWYDNEGSTVQLATGALSAQNRERIDAKFTPYLGAIWDFSDRASLYGSYTEIFQPQTDLTAAGDSIKPRTGTQYEIGLKAEPLDGVNATLAYFHIQDRNRAVRDPLDMTAAAPLGEATQQGVEFEVSGALTDRLQLSAGYTYTDSSYADTERPTANILEYDAPHHMAQVWAKYSFDERDGWLDGLWLGGGFRAFSDYSSLVRLANGSSTLVRAPGYVVADLAAGYRINDDWSLTLNVNNVLDKKYYERAHGPTTFNFYGEPRNVQFRVNAEF